MSVNHSHGDFIATDIASIAANTTFTHAAASEYTSLVVAVYDVDYITLQGRATGETGSDEDVDFNIVGTLDEVLWDTIVIATISLTLAGAVQIVESDPLDVRGLRAIRLATVENKDDAAVTLVNLKWGKSFGYIR